MKATELRNVLSAADDDYRNGYAANLDSLWLLLQTLLHHEADKAEAFERQQKHKRSGPPRVQS